MAAHQSPHACDFAGNSTHKQILGQIAEEFEAIRIVSSLTELQGTSDVKSSASDCVGHSAWRFHDALAMLETSVGCRSSHRVLGKGAMGLNSRSTGDPIRGTVVPRRRQIAWHKESAVGRSSAGRHGRTGGHVNMLISAPSAT